MSESNEIPELKFFGKVTASLSHDLKNVLAIVNENAGLMEDMLLLYGRGREINTERLIAAAKAINTQVRRGEAVIGNLNRLAHSADDASAVVAVEKAVELAVGISARMAAMRGVSVTVAPPPESIRLKTSPFAFQELIWICLDRTSAMESGGERSVHVAVEPSGNGACIRFRGRSGKRPDFPADERDLELLRSAGAEATVNQDTGEMIITLTPEVK
jgi:C4-dicarboxylate-specific signal transduction histidine kinase